MQKNIIPAISTGRFAKLCGTSKRTLVHYDEIGLFRPAMTDERGYRYYTEAQCDVFAIITALKELGMPLQEIQSYLDNRSPAALKTLLQTQRELVRQELENLRRIDRMIATKLQLLEQGAGGAQRQQRQTRFLGQMLPARLASGGACAPGLAYGGIIAVQQHPGALHLYTAERPVQQHHKDPEVGQKSPVLLRFGISGQHHCVDPVVAAEFQPLQVILQV